MTKKNQLILTELISFIDDHEKPCTRCKKDTQQKRSYLQALTGLVIRERCIHCDTITGVYF